MKYIELFKKVAYLDKPINYFRGLPGEEGMLFCEMYTWLVSQGTPKYTIETIFNKIRACYLGILFEVENNDVAAADFGYYDLLPDEQAAVAIYLKSVADPTPFGEFKVIANGLISKYADCNMTAYVGMSDYLIERVKGIGDRFHSSFTPEIDNWRWVHVERENTPPARWDYWKDWGGDSVFDETKLFLHKDFEEVRFVVDLFSTKGWKLTACDALETAIKEGYRRWN